MNVLCIDPGIVSVGIFYATLTPTGEIAEIKLCVNVDMTKPFSSPKNLHIYICKFMEMYAENILGADVIILEKQPIGSAGYPLELVFRERYAYKCQYVHPATLHRHYGLAGYEYDARKSRCVELVKNVLKQWEEEGCPGAAEAVVYIDSAERKHDCCDACLFFMYYATVVHKPVLKDTHVPGADGQTFEQFLSQFLYKAEPRM